jgi:dipeptidyl-peptidase-4
MKILFRIILSGLCLFLTFDLVAQKKSLTDDEIWSDEVRITEPLMRILEWTGNKVILSGANNKTFAADLQTGKLTSYGGKIEAKSNWTVSVVDGDIVLQRPDGSSEKMTNTPDEEINPTLSPDNSFVAFTRNNDLYTIRLDDKKETRLTTDGNDVILNGYASWVYMEEILGRSGRYRAFWWSPDSKHIAFFRADDSEVPLFTITDSPGQNGYVETWRYPKPGNNIPQVRVGIVKPDGGDIVWATIDEKDNHYFGLPYWRPDGKAVWLQWLNYEQNNLKILEVDITTGVPRELYNEHQKTWIAIDHEPRIHFLESGMGFILESDKSGWNQLYLHDMRGNVINQITNGTYTVLNVLKVDEAEKVVYFTCYKDNIGCVDFYKAGLNGENLQRLSFGDYTHQISLSDDAKYFVTAYSNVKTPRKMALYTTEGKLVAELQDTKNANFDRYERPLTEMVILKSDDGLFDLPMRITWPLNREKGKTYPVKINIYGGPGSMSVYGHWLDVFGGESYQYAKDGLIQIVLDHRGSGHNGKVGQDCMHRNLGYWEMKDYMQCVKWLISEGYVNPEKVMITGFSYGGYLTSYALTYGAEVFTHGIAGGSVTDWLLYDATYTERFMDTPAENPEGYQTSSVLTHAGKLKGKLLLTHGLRDENVHVQNTFQLISLLEDLYKDVELMVYPESRHGYRGTKLWYSRNRSAEFVYNYLIEKPVPARMLRALTK